MLADEFLLCVQVYKVSNHPGLQFDCVLLQILQLYPTEILDLKVRPKDLLGPLLLEPMLRISLLMPHRQVTELMPLL